MTARLVLRLICGYLVLAALFARRHRWRYLTALCCVAAFAAVSVHFDAQVMATIKEGDSPAIREWGSRLSKLGKTDAMTLYITLALLVIGGVMRRARIARVGLLVLLAVAVSGIGVNVLRPLFGRARPYSEHGGDFTFLSAKHEFNSFPSGHSSEAWAVGVVLAAACPPAAVPVGIYAGQMLWARMEVERHFPTDVLVGAAWGMMCGMPFAYFAYCDIRPRGRRRKVLASAQNTGATEKAGS